MRNPSAQCLICHLSSAIFPLLVAVLTGCAHSTGKPTSFPADITDSQLLFLHSAPHRSLYVEVDAVKGATPSKTELRKLDAALRQWCDKPDGIKIVRSTTIARSAARGRSADSLARQFMDGPGTTTNAAQPAYLYVLFYDNRVNRNPLQSPRAASQGPARDVVDPELAEPENPHVMLSRYPAMIYVDQSWLNGLVPYKYRAGLIHEAGHILGLVRREARIKGLHCPTKACC